MPFDVDQGVAYGDDARKVPQWARETFCAWLQAKLNDPSGPYAALLGITSQRQALVSDNVVKLRASYSDAQNPPVVSVMQGPTDPSSKSKKVNGVVYEGMRREVTLELDMGVKAAPPEESENSDDQTAKVQDDSVLADLVGDAIERGFEELDERGLYNSNLVPDEQKQRAKEGRHPHRFTFFCLSLDDWTP